MADFEKGAGAQAGAGATKVVLKENKPKTRSASVTKEVTMSDFMKGQPGTTVDSKKRDAPTEEDVDVEAATKVGKLDATEASNPLR
jgi:hypothetical protein